MLRYVTTNPGKVREAEEYLGGTVGRLAYDYPEVQADDLGPIAAHGAREAYRHAVSEADESSEPTTAVLVDDAGLFVDALEGFPGPYSAYVEDTLGIERVWNLAEDLADRRASFRCVLAYCDGGPIEAAPDSSGHEPGDPPVKLFEGTVRGRLVAPRGAGGFGYDPIFEHAGTTFAEMTAEEKNAVSHRGRALAAFAEWYSSR